MSFEIMLGSNSVKWTADDVKSKLDVIYKNKKTTWIRSDLSISDSNWLTHMTWTLIGQHFQSVRSYYQVGLEKSKEVLEQLGRQISQRNDHALIELFNQAIVNFNRIDRNTQITKNIEDSIATALHMEDEDPKLTDELLSFIGKKQMKTDVPGAIETLQLIDDPQIKADAILALLEYIGETKILKR